MEIPCILEAYSPFQLISAIYQDTVELTEPRQRATFPLKLLREVLDGYSRLLSRPSLSPRSQSPSRSGEGRDERLPGHGECPPDHRECGVPNSQGQHRFQPYRRFLAVGENAWGAYFMGKFRLLWASGV